MKKILTVFLAVMMVALLVPGLSLAEEPLRIAALKGPTGMGMAPLMTDEKTPYQFSLAASPEELVGQIVQGKVDVAAVPTNLAAVLYQKTEGKVKMLAINTLGVIDILSKDPAITKVEDLAGKTIVAAGQGSVPEYVLQYVLDAHNVKATIEFKAEHTEAMTLAAAGKADIVLLPQPMATSLLMKDPAFKVAVNMTEAFQEAAAKDGKPGTALSMGALIVQSEVAEKRAAELAQFVDSYKKAIAFVNEKPAEAGEMIAKLDIVPNAKLAEKAIPLSHIVFVDGEDMVTQLAPLYEILFAKNPKSIGGKVPDPAFYLPATK